MLIRALIVVLAIFNAGVALWWWSQPPVTDAPVPVMSPPEGGALLQLRSEVPVLAADAAAQDNALALPVAASAADNAAPAGSDTDAGALAGSAQGAATVASAPPPPVCVSLGAFADRAQLDAAQQRAAGIFAVARPRESASSSSGSYRVMLPPAESREAAQATVRRIVAAGISDYFIIGQGELANAVALGQFRNRDGAQRRLDQLQAAGFAAQIVPSASAQSRWWLDARLAAGISAAQARQRSAAPQVQSLDCAVLR